MRPVAVIENDELLTGAGWVGRALDARGVPWRTLRGFAGETAGLAAADWSALVVMGGRQHAWEEAEHPQLRHEREAMTDAVERGIPVLGCCLGGQVLARALGGAVYTAERGEFGWPVIRTTPAAADDPLLRHGVPEARVYQWHGDAFTLPPGAVHLAGSEAAPVQAFRFGSAWGLQFHPEVDLAVFDLWHANFPGAGETVGIDPVAARAEAARREDEPAEFARRMLVAFAEIVATGAA